MSTFDLLNKKTLHFSFKRCYNDDNSKFNFKIIIERDCYSIDNLSMIDMFPDLLHDFEHINIDLAEHHYSVYTHTSNYMYDNNSSGLVDYLNYVKKFILVFGDIASFDSL